MPKKLGPLDRFVRASGGLVTVYRGFPNDNGIRVHEERHENYAEWWGVQHRWHGLTSPLLGPWGFVVGQVVGRYPLTVRLSHRKHFSATWRLWANSADGRGGRSHMSTLSGGIRNGDNTQPRLTIEIQSYRFTPWEILCNRCTGYRKGALHVQFNFGTLRIEPWGTSSICNSEKNSQNVENIQDNRLRNFKVPAKRGWYQA